MGWSEACYYLVFVETKFRYEKVQEDRCYFTLFYFKRGIICLRELYLEYNNYWIASFIFIFNVCANILRSKFRWYSYTLIEN